MNFDLLLKKAKKQTQKIEQINEIKNIDLNFSNLNIELINKQKSNKI